MNQPSAVKFQHHIQSGGLFFLNSSLVEAEIIRGDIEIVRVPANKIAEDLANPRAANMIMLGAFARKSGLVEMNSLVAALRRTLSAKKKLIEINEKALEAGYNLF
jgi:2-oxoglutarate ferredoxin oxidoreductase subunit gamma